MVADIFEKDYFDKRRQMEGSSKVEKGKTSRFLNIKRKAKPAKLKEEKNLDFNDVAEEESMDEGVYEAKSPVKSDISGWRRDFLSSSVAGFSGGFVVFVFLLRFAMGFHWKGTEFWGGIVLILVLALIVYLLLSLILKTLDR